MRTFVRSQFQLSLSCILDGLGSALLGLTRTFDPLKNKRDVLQIGVVCTYFLPSGHRKTLAFFQIECQNR